MAALSQDVYAQSNYTRTATSVGASAQEWDTYRRTVAQIESSGSGGYSSVGGSGNHYEGAYQMGAAAKTDAARRLGISTPSRSEFLANPDLQEKMFDAYTQQNHETLMRKNSQYASMSPSEQLAVLGYAHNQGAGGADEWLNSGVAGRDGFGTDATKYYNAVLENTGSESTLAASGVGGYTGTGAAASGAASQSQNPAGLGTIGRTGDMLRKNMDFMSHTIKVLGDFHLNPGTIVNLSIQKAADIEAMGLSSIEDEFLSGEYFISGATHVFNGDGFYTYATVSRDSSSVSLSGSSTESTAQPTSGLDTTGTSQSTNEGKSSSTNKPTSSTILNDDANTPEGGAIVDQGTAQAWDPKIGTTKSSNQQNVVDTNNE